MKKKLLIALGLLLFAKLFAIDYAFDDILLIYLSRFYDSSWEYKFENVLLDNPNKNSFSHYAHYKIDSYGNKRLDDEEFRSEYTGVVNYKDGKMVKMGVTDIVRDNNTLTLIAKEYDEIQIYRFDYLNENEVDIYKTAYGKTEHVYKITKDDNEFKIENIKKSHTTSDYTFIFNEDSIVLYRDRGEYKGNKRIDKITYDSHGIMLQYIEDYGLDTEKVFVEYSGVNGQITEKSFGSKYINKNFYRRVDKDGYLVYQTDDIKCRYSYMELTILPCDDEGNILATVEEVAVPVPEVVEEETPEPELVVQQPDVQESSTSQVSEKPNRISNNLILWIVIVTVGILLLVFLLIFLRNKKNGRKQEK